MGGERETVRVWAIVAAAVVFLFAAAIILVNNAGTSVATPAAVQRGVPAAVKLGYDLSALPADAVLVIERKSGPKGAYQEVARSSGSSGLLSVDASTDPRAVMRYTVLTASGDVLLRFEGGR